MTAILNKLGRYYIVTAESSRAAHQLLEDNEMCSGLLQEEFPEYSKLLFWKAKWKPGIYELWVYV